MSTFRLVSTQKTFTVYSKTTELEMIQWFTENVPSFHLDGRYVLLEEQTGDCIIYENGKIDRVSDSG